MSTVAEPTSNGHGAPPGPREVRVAVVGAGFGGLGAAIRLREQGIEDFVVLERAEALGGTWRANTYPGAACDVPSHLYSFSFAPNPDWSRFFAPQGEILAYLQRTARERGIEDHILYGAEVQAAHWDEAAQRWHLDTAAGPVRAQALIAATGPLSEPNIPPLPGLETFSGKVFHSAEWDHAHDLTGRRIAVVGTGASAAQFIPLIQQQAAQLDVYQRTAGWIMPRGDRPIPLLERRLFRRLPRLQRAFRAAIYYGAETLLVGLVIDQRFLKLPEWVGRRKLRRSVPDPALRAKLTPKFRIGCKRIIFSDDYLPALTQPNVELVTDAIREVTPTGIVTNDGTERAVDTIIMGTGFKVWDSPTAARIRGRDGRSLAERWADSSPQAYVGTVMAGYPNFFFLIGPNTGLGNNSMINIIEAQLDYVLDALRALGRGGALEVRQDVQDRYNAEIQEMLRGTVWLDGGCNSWYLSADGTNRTLWPTFSDRFKARARGFDVADFEVTRAPAEAAATRSP